MVVRSPSASTIAPLSATTEYAGDLFDIRKLLIELLTTPLRSMDPPVFDAAQLTDSTINPLAQAMLRAVGDVPSMSVDFSLTLFLEIAANDLRQLEFKKNQYGPTGETIVLRYQNGMFLPLPGMASLDKAAQEAKADQIFLELLARFTTENRNVSDKKGPSYAPAFFAKEEEAKRAGLTGKALEAAMRRLFKAGAIWNEPYGKPSRLHHRIARRI